ncbi:MAG: PqqD family protein [Erythrobacter sp.]
MELDLNSKLTATEGVVSCEIDDGMIVLNLDTSRYLKLNDTASSIWKELTSNEDRTCSVSHLLDMIMNQYDAEETLVIQDITKLLNDLDAAKLVEIRSS